MSYRHDGTTRDATIRCRQIKPADALVLRLFVYATLLVGLLYYGIALLALLSQGRSTPARVLALLNLTMAMLMFSMPTGMVSGMKPPEVAPLFADYQKVVGVLLLFGVGFALHLALIFPAPVRWLRTRAWLLYGLCYAPGLLALPGEVFGVARLVSLKEFAGLLTFIQFVAAMVYLFRGRRRATTTLERRQVKAVIMGVVLGPVIVLVIVLLVLLLSVLQIVEHVPESLVIAVVLFSFCLALLPIPVSFLYAFGKYRLMEVELRMRRGTRFALTAGVMLLVFFSVLYGASRLVLHTLDVKNSGGVLAVALLLALGAAPVQRRAQKFMERRFFPERQRLRVMLRETLASSALMPDRASLWDRLETDLGRAMGVTASTPLLRDPRNACFHLPNGDHAPFDPEGALASELVRSAGPLLVDELLAGGRVPVSAAEEGWLRERRVALLLPMIVHSRLTGFLALSFAQGSEDLAPEDLGVLTSVVSQLALQSENLRLIEENLEKRRLEEQLAMARDVQQRFLPQTLPEAPGLELAARFRSSLEVAGDYYDVLPLSDGRTLLAVADVAGKGAGAAMIMANVQASLRSMTRAGVGLAEMVTAMNESIRASTSPEQFVTFFAAVYDPAAHALFSINAGHNPPRLIRACGMVQPLVDGGPVLGVLPCDDYVVECVPVSPGDVLVAFTDGISEAMNAGLDEFGEEQIITVCQPLCKESAEIMADAIDRAVTDFHGSASFEDDFTLLVAKIR